MKRFKIQY